MTRQEFLDAIQGNIFTVTFIKKDGTERVLNGTTDFQRIPYQAVGDSTRKTSETYVTVWDIDANGWRMVDPSKIVKLVVHDSNGMPEAF